jgi:hypothetical protein
MHSPAKSRLRRFDSDTSLLNTGRSSRQLATAAVLKTAERIALRVRPSHLPLMGESQRILKLTLYIDDKVPERKVAEIDDLISRLREEISFISDWNQTLFGAGWEYTNIVTH